MKKTAPHLAKSFWYGMLCCFFLISCKEDTKVENKESNGDLAYRSEASACNCEDSWFPHAQTPAPEEGKGSPFDTKSTTNCMFHQWSWQKFLWLTKPQSNNNPLFLNELTQVDDDLTPTPKQSGATIALKYTQQAGSNGVLTANPHYASDSKNPNVNYTVYYSIHSNDILLKAAKNFKDSIISKKISENNLKMFPVGALELKVSWVDVNTIKADEQQHYFITTAAVVDNKGNYQLRKMALLGMHVVGVVINHPEFIWATFQHKDIAPVYDWKKHAVDSNAERLLYTPKANALQGILYGGNNQPYDLFKFGVPKTQDDEFMKTCQQEPMNFDNIKSINDCVASKLDDVWKNYFYNGSIWIDTDGMLPEKQAETLVTWGDSLNNAKPNGIARGSLNNANITMETFTQTFQKDINAINVSNVVNCLDCHNAVSFAQGKPRSPLYVSHIFNAYIKKSQGKTTLEIDQLKDVDFSQELQKRAAN